MRYPKSYYDAGKLQDGIMELSAAKPLREMANLAKAYATLEALKLRLRMKGPPKPVDAEKQASRRPSAVTSPME
jgi:hypothetical protein